jgi:hypothetical protein
MRTHLVACVLLASFAHETMASPGDIRSLAQLEQAERMWLAAEISGYRYRLIKGGVFGYSEYTVKVNDGSCTARSRFVFDKPQRWRRAKCDGLTIPELFSEVRQQLMRGTRRVEMKIDESVGYVVTFNAEPDTDLTDQDWYLRVSDFRATSRVPKETMEPIR